MSARHGLESGSILIRNKAREGTLQALACVALGNATRTSGLEWVWSLSRFLPEESTAACMMHVGSVATSSGTSTPLSVQ